MEKKWIDSLENLSLTELFVKQKEKLKDQAIIYSKDKQPNEQSNWTQHSWQDIERLAINLAARLDKAGVKKGEKILLMSANSPSWLIAELAILSLNGIVVPVYANYLSKDLDFVVKHQSCRFCLITEDLAKTHKIKGVTSIIIDRVDENVAVKKGFSLVPKGVKPDDIALVIFTSATSGNPKGVMLSHRNVLSNVQSAIIMVENSIIAGKKHSFFSFLPIAHSYEHMAGLWLPLAMNATIYYPKNIESLLADIGSAGVSLITVVPRFISTIRNRLIQRSKLAKGLQGLILRTAVAYAENQKISYPQKFALLGLFIIKKRLNKMLGGKHPYLFSGGASLNAEHERFFKRLGVNIMQGYGLTEASPLVSVCPPGREKEGSVGPVIPNVEVKINKDNELLVKGKNVMKSYDKDKQATSNTFQGGWLKTGDLARIDEDGYIFILDRKKDIIVNEQGENISPVNLETELELEDEIMQAVIFGDSKPFLTAVIVANPDENYSKEDLQNAISRANKKFRISEKIRKFIKADEAFTVENSMLTTTMKIKRHEIYRAYEQKIKSLYK